MDRECRDDLRKRGQPGDRVSPHPAGARNHQVKTVSPAPSGLSVIIVSWNAASTIGPCLDSLLENAPDRFFEILVVDN
ncbi:MAG: glycosyltransferase, partial [Vicinamibacteria bacterium]